MRVRTPGISEFRQVDRRLAVSFGALVLLLMLTVTSVASYLFLQLQAREEDRLSGALAVVMSESISRISFSGKYHARLLVEEMRARVPELVFLSVESTNGIVLAHSDPERNDRQVPPESMPSLHRCLGQEAPVINEHRYQGRTVKEIVLPYRGNLDGSVEGVVRLGINVEDVRGAQRSSRFMLFPLIAALTVAAMGVVFVLSRRFGRSVRALAAQLQGVMNHAPMAVSITDRAGQLVAQSVEFESLFGRPRPLENLEEFLRERLPEPELRRLCDIDRQILDHGGRTQEEMAVLLQGKRSYWAVSKFPIARDRKGQVSLICTFIRDITERNQTLEALRESEATFRRLFESSSDAILLLKDSRFLECNQAAVTALRHTSRDSILNASPADISPERQADGRLSVEASAQYDAVALRDGYKRFEWICRRADRTLLHLDVALTRVVIRGETMLHVTWRDITERKRAELERERLQAQLLQAHKMESVGRLAGGVAHDFNNMLQAILGNAALTLAALPPDSPLRENLEEIERSAERSASLTRQLLAFARKQTAVPKVLDLNETVEGMLKMLHRLIGEDIQLSWLPKPKLWRVRMDPSQVDQVLANLCVNARDAIGGVGQVAISTENVVVDAASALHEDANPGDYVQLTVQDTGSGMDKEVLAHLFEPFYTTKEVGKGTGLGLATVYGIVKQNYGFIQVESALGRGTKFQILLPRYLGELPQPTAQSPAEAPLRGHETILVVEDEQAILRITQRSLHDLGYRVLTAAAPVEALQLVKQHPSPIDLLITDLVMPEMNGKDLAAQLRAANPRMRCLFMSGYTADVIAHHGVLDEGVCFLQKPFSPKELSKHVRVALDSENSGTSLPASS